MKNLILLFGTFFKIGLFSFGGGNAMLPLIYQSMGELRGI
ncbi:MAG: chromate transporter, partial [Bacillota bacterium]|nr:chromate transporter [Bacillota bacterium]